jgi:hypothetical protein
MVKGADPVRARLPTSKVEAWEVNPERLAVINTHLAAKQGWKAEPDVNLLEPPLMT